MAEPKYVPVMIRTINGEVEALSIRRRGTLCVHQSLNVVPTVGMYTVTHVPTGLSIAAGKPKFVAFRILELIGDLPDWSFVSEDGDVSRCQMLKKAVMAATERAELEGMSIRNRMTKESFDLWLD